MKQVIIAVPWADELVNVAVEPWVRALGGVDCGEDPGDAVGGVFDPDVEIPSSDTVPRIPQKPWPRLPDAARRATRGLALAGR